MKSLKRSVSVLLAMLMIFSSFSLLASAADLDNDSIAFDTKFYRQVTDEDGKTSWEETTKAKPGENIKVRFFIETGFVLGATDFFWLYSKNSITMSDEYTEDKITPVVTNPDENSEAFISEIGADFAYGTNPTKGVGYNVVDFGYLPEDTYDNFGYIYTMLSEGKATYLSGDYWLYEFDFTVNEDPAGPAQVYFPVEALITSDEDSWDAASFFGRHDASDSGAGVNVGRNNEESYDWDPIVISNDTDPDSTLSFDNTLTFKNGETTVAEYTGTIGTSVGADATFTLPEASAAGQKFLGWSLDGTNIISEADIKAMTYGYDAITLTPVFESASASYVQNVYTMGTDGKYGKPKTDNISAATDDKVKASDYTAIDEGFALDADMSTKGEVTVTSDGLATLNIYLKRNSYDVVFNNEDGTEAAKLNGLYGATVTAPAADEKTGWTFAGWSNGTDTVAAGAAVEVPLNGATYTATYTANANSVVINAVYTDAVTGESVTVPVKTVDTTTGYTVKIVDVIPEDADKEANVTYVLKSDLAEINTHYELADSNTTWEIKVADDGKASLDLAYTAKTYTVVFDDGVTKTSNDYTYYSEVETPEAADKTNVGKSFKEWTGDNDTAYPELEVFNVTGNVTYTATYTDIEYALTYIVDGERPENYEEPEAETVKYGSTFKLSDLAEVAHVTGYAFSGWTVESGATYDDATGLYTVTGDVEVVGEWTHTEYTLSYYLTEDDYTAGNAYETVPYFYDDTIDAFEPDQADILGKEFIEWETVDGEAMPETMPAYNLAVIASTNDYEVIFYDEFGDVSAEYYGMETVTEANAPDMTSDEFDFGGWLVNGETDTAKAVTTFSYDVAGNYYFVPVCTVDVVYYEDYDENLNPINEYKTLTYDFGYIPAEDDAQLAALGTPTKEGHKFDGWDFDIIDNELTSHNYAVAIWTPKAYTATFNAVNGDLAGAFADSTTTKTVENVTYGDTITFADVPVLAGYTFTGWTDVEGGTVKVDPLTMNKEGKTFYAIYTANGQAGYTVEIYLMGTDGTYADTASSTDTTKTGTIGVAAEAAHADYAQEAHFSADTENKDNVTSAVVAEDGSTVLKLYYARASYEVKVDGVAQDKKVYHEATFTAPATSTTTEAGYTLTGWTDADGNSYEKGEEITVTGALELTAVNTANTDTAYTVNIYTMDTTGAYGEAKKVEGTVGTTGTTATYTAAPGEGLYLDETLSTKDLSTTITADDTDVINVYYARNAYEVTVDGVAQDKEVYHGATFTTPTTSTTTETGYTLTGWSDGAKTYGKGEAITVTGALELTAVNTANTDTAYKVEIYLMNENGDYILRDTDFKTGTTDTLATAAHADYIAYIDSFYSADAENVNNVTSDKIAGNGSTTLKLYYKRAQYEVTVDGVAQTEKVYHGATFTAPSTSTTTKAGYTLASWNNGTYAKGEVITVTGVLALTADNTANTDTAYKVEIYLMNENGDYILRDTDFKTGTTDTLATAAHADYIAYIDSFYSADAENVNNVTSKNIEGDDSTTLKLYYKRASYTYSFTAKTDADAEAEVVASGTAYHGATIKTPAYTADAGYTFGGWTDGENTYAANTNITVESDLAYTAIITANSGIAYKVETHVMNTDGTTYEVTTETLYGKTGDPVSTHPASMEGFTPNADESVLEGTIAADGSTTLKVVYDRNKYTITVNGVEDEYLYGEEIEIAPVPEDEIDEGYKQDGWVDENGKPVTVPYPVDENNPTEIKPNIVPIEYLVEFTVNGKAFVSAQAAFGTPITDPGTPGEDWIPEGYTFGGWSVDGVTEVTDFGTVGTSGNTFVAILTANSYNLTFKDAEGNVLSGPTSTEFGSTLAALAPTAPDKTESGLIFAGWAEEADTTVKMPATMPAKDVVYKATYVQNTTPVKYSIQVYMMDTNGDYTLSATTVSYGYIGTTQTIEAGEVLGCSVDTEKSHLSDVIASDGSTVLTIYYARNIYTVTFGDNAPVDVYYGAAIPVPADPVSTEDGKAFAGWTPEVPKTMPANNLVFEATWELGVYTITYVINGETKEPISYTYGEAVATPETPDVDGLKFLGWTPEVPKTMPAKDLIIVAEFEADLFKVTFLDDVDGEVFDVKYVEYGDAITLPTGEPTKEYHTFEGWLAVPETMPAEDIVIVPDFARVPVTLVPQEGSTTVIDRDNMIIYGLDTRMRASEYGDTYLDVVGDGYFTVTPAEGKAGFYGTGTVIELYDNNSETGDPIETYYVVIFGDVNGDSDVNAADASAVEDEYFWVTGWSREGSDDYAYYKLRAGDLDNDGDIDVNDHTNIVNYTVGVIAIDQTTGTVDR